MTGPVFVDANVFLYARNEASVTNRGRSRFFARKVKIGDRLRNQEEAKFGARPQGLNKPELA